MESEWESALDRNRPRVRRIGWMLGISVIAPDGDAGEDRAGAALLLIAAPEGEAPEAGGGDLAAAGHREWASGIVSRLARELRARGWDAPDTLDGCQAFNVDDGYGDLDFSATSGEGWELAPGRFAIADAKALSGTGEAALRKAYFDLEACAGELGLLTGPFAGEIRGFDQWIGLPGFVGRERHPYTDDGLIGELGRKLATALQSEALDKAALPASASPGKKPGL